MVDIAHEDAETFVIFQQEDVPDDFQIDPNDCMTPQGLRSSGFSSVIELF